MKSHLKFFTLKGAKAPSRFKRQFPLRALRFCMSCVCVLLIHSFSSSASAATNATEALPSCCRPVAAQTNYTDRSVYLLDSTWTSDADKKVKLGTLRGKPQIVAMFFASCQFTCPLTVNDMKNIEAALPENVRTNVGFTLVSFDSQRDTPAALKAYRARHEMNGRNWTLLRGDPDDVRELAALLGVIYKQDSNGDFAHSNLITVLNAEGEIIFQKQGVNIDPQEIVRQIEQIQNRKS
jgi:protein SCO1/2